MVKRGQAALEFLSTYGFAFLIILVMIGALTYFGVLSPSRFVPERCLMGSEFSCDDFQVDVDPGLPGSDADDAAVTVFIVNQKGNTVTIDMAADGSAVSTGFGQSAAGACTIDLDGAAGPIAEAGSANIVGGGSAHLRCLMPGAFPAAGEKVKVNLNFAYTELGGQFPHPVAGEVLATLQ